MADVVIGAHISAAGGMANAYKNAQNIGAEALQTHPSPPQSWFPVNRNLWTRSTLEKLETLYGHKPHFFHAPYLINLAASTPEHLEKSIQALVSHLVVASDLGVSGVIFHPGSHKGVGFSAVASQMQQALTRIVESVPDPSLLIIENAAGAGGVIGTFEEIASLLAAPGLDMVGVCLDTCHTFAQNEDVSTQAAVETTVGRFTSLLGTGRLRAVHANDSQHPLGSHRDRHQNIGEGFIGETGFAAMLANPLLAGVPWLLEVPGLMHQGPDLENINRLRTLAGLSPKSGAPEVKNWNVPIGVARIPER